MLFNNKILYENLTIVHYIYLRSLHFIQNFNEID